MKNFITVSLLLIAFSLTAQKKEFSNKNYYDYYVNFPEIKSKGLSGKKLSTAWLNSKDVTPIIMQEMQDAGLQWLYDNVLFKVNVAQYIVLTAYSRKSNFGFLYISGHQAKISKEHRINLTQMKEEGVDYVSCEETPSGNPNFIKIPKLPENVFVLNENCYWYQYTENPDDQDKLFSKDNAIEILRQDVKEYLLKVKK